MRDDQNATRTLDIDYQADEMESSAIARAKRNIEITQGLMEGSLKTGVYRGEAGYMNQFNLTDADLKHK